MVSLIGIYIGSIIHLGLNLLFIYISFELAADKGRDFAYSNQNWASNIAMLLSEPGMSLRHQGFQLPLTFNGYLWGTFLYILFVLGKKTWFDKRKE